MCLHTGGNGETEAWAGAVPAPHAVLLAQRRGRHFAGPSDEFVRSLLRGNAAGHLHRVEVAQEGERPGRGGGERQRLALSARERGAFDADQLLVGAAERQGQGVFFFALLATLRETSAGALSACGGMPSIARASRRRAWRVALDQGHEG